LFSLLLSHLTLLLLYRFIIIDYIYSAVPVSFPSSSSSSFPSTTNDVGRHEGSSSLFMVSSRSSPATLLSTYTVRSRKASSTLALS
ncbi:hypothetical protein PFISCL1PPCAC_9440, partial [Pristionchus fissidentatus]